jgi:Tol biopolymer transport system component
MRKTKHGRAVAVLLTALLAVLLMAPVAVAETVGTASFPGTGGAIAFTSDREGVTTLQVYRMNADGFGQTRLTEVLGNNQDPTWSADGKKIAFTNFDANREIYQMNADGSEERNLPNAAGDDVFPAYSSTETRIVFTSSRDDNQFDLYLMTLNASGQTTGLTRLTTSAAQDYLPTVSPDGKRVAFVSDRGGNRDIYVMKLAPESATNRPVRLTRSAAYDQFPDWSPDGRQIAFSSERSGNPEVYRMAVAPEGRTNKPVNLSKNPARDLVPTWSPDGKKVAFQSNRPAADGTTDYEIWRVKAADGANPTNLTNNTTNEYQPDWQPLP